MPGDLKNKSFAFFRCIERYFIQYSKMYHFIKDATRDIKFKFRAFPLNNIKITLLQ